MSTNYRPGGLTALAVFNFIFTVYWGFAALGVIVNYAQSQGNLEGRHDLERSALEAYAEMGLPFCAVVAVLQGLVAILLLISGIGYLKLSRVLGRALGSAAAVVSIAVSMIYVAVVPVAAGGTFTLGTMANTLFPLLSLLLINTTFKPDFTR